MFFQILVTLCVGIYADSKNIPILRQIFDIDPDGTYNYAFETGNLLFAEEQGYWKEMDIHVKKGQYQYTSPEGQIVRITYTADENGFQPQGAELPTPPPIPPLIKRALEFQNS